MIDIAGVRKAILDSLQSSVNGRGIETSVLANEQEMTKLLDTIQTTGISNNFQAGTDANGNTYFIVGISAVGGTDIVAP